MSVNVHIERLVLDGYPSGAAGGAQFEQALNAELTRLLQDGGVAPDLAQGGAVPYLRGGDMGNRALQGATLGTEVARAVYGGLGAC